MPTLIIDPLIWLKTLVLRRKFYQMLGFVCLPRSLDDGRIAANSAKFGSLVSLYLIRLARLIRGSSTDWAP